MKLRIVALLSALVLCTGCITTMALTAVVLSNITPGEKVVLKGRVTGSVPEQEKAALMQTGTGDTVCIVYDFKKYKEGQRIKAKFIRGGLYKYTDTQGTERYAPIFIRAKDFKTLWWVAVSLDVNSPQEERKAEVFT